MRIALSLVALVGCTTSEPVELSPPVEPPPLVPEVVIQPVGTFHLTTHIDLTVDAPLVAHPSAYNRALRDFVSAPGPQMVAMADGSPALAVLRAQLSPAQMTSVEGWITESMNPLGVLSVLAVATTVKSSLDTFDLDSELVFTNGIARHRFVSIDFTRGGFDGQTFDLGSEPGEQLEGMPRVTTYGNTMMLGAHTVALGVGAYAWLAVDAQLDQTGGVRGTLGAATQCGLLALAVAAKGVGHAVELDQMCEAALDAITVKSRDEAAAFQLTALQLQGGVGMLDANEDQIADGLFGGSWTATADTGNGPTAISPRFE